MSLTSEVVLCTYNGAEFVIEQVQSILRQTKRVDRISIYDDRSTDDTVPKIRSFVQQLSPDDQRLFKIDINERNLGYARNFSQAIGRSTEDTLFLCDQDDIWEPAKVEVFLDLFEKHDPDMVFSDGSLIDESGRRLCRASVLESYGLTRTLTSSFRHRAFGLLTKRNYIAGSAAAVARRAAQAALPLPCDMPHDYWLAIWCSLHKGIVGTPLQLYRYRQHGNNVIGGVISSNPLHVLLGIWRQPDAPRERELRIWKAVTERIATLPCRDQIETAQRKLEWLSRVVPSEKKTLPRVVQIAKSAFDGSYRRHSAPHAFLRDVVSLIK
jgi:glycosyltransferase involved in cell wall biosynthesis